MPPEFREAVGPERRTRRGTDVRFERRDGDSAPAGGDIVGHAAVFDQWTTLYEGRYWTWREIIRPGAFRNALKEGQDVRSLFNHDPNFVLGRTTSGTLKLSEDETGLLSRTTPPGTQTIRDLVITPMERQDITGMSFAFSIRAGEKTVTTEGEDGTYTLDRGGERVTLRYEGDRLIEEREVLDADLYDVSPVTYPAYEGTDCAIDSRSAPDLRSLIAEKDRPHTRKVATPNLDEVRRMLEERANAARGVRKGKAVTGRGK